MTPYVVTLYSFKGGVGRTTLLVNLAHVLAARGERVLIWDVDLEAPGVHCFPGLEPPEALWQSGFLEWLGETPPCPTEEPTPDWPSPAWLATLRDRVYRARGDTAGAPRGQIFVLPAHGTNARLGRAYAAVDWHGLFVEHPAHGLHLFARVRDALIEAFEPTFLFIDSRTGISDLGGVLTGLLPDCTVLVGNYSRQSTEGLRGVYLALDRFATERVKGEPFREHKLERVLVASPVPPSLPARERGRERWRAGFPGEAPRSLIEVPLVESLIFAEDVLVRSAPSSDAARAYRAVGDALFELRQVRARSERGAPAAPDDARAERRLRRLLALLGFELEGGAELVIRQRTIAGELAYRVDHEPGTARADAAFRARIARLASHESSPVRGALIIAEAARDDARAIARDAGVVLRTRRELEDQLVDLRAYAAAVRRTFEASELPRAYVAPRVATGGAPADALEQALAWIAGGEPRLLLVRGAAGSGKTSFLRRLAYELATRAETEPDAPTPILLALQPGASLEALLQQHLRAMIGWHGPPEAILYLLQAGRAILLVDGFDELVASPAEIDEQLRRFTLPTEEPGLVPWANRVIATWRPAAPGVAAKIIDLSPFESDQVARFLTNRLGADRARAALDVIGSPPDGAAATPMWLEMFATTALDDGVIASDSGAPRAVDLFERHVQRWIAGDGTDDVAPAERARFLETLATELWRHAARELPGEQLVAALARTAPEPAAQGSPRAPRAARLGEPPAPVWRIFGTLTGRKRKHAHDDALETIARAFRSAPFITRSESGAYGFTHRSIHDYVLARYLFRTALQGADALRDALATERLDTMCAQMFVELADERTGVRDVVRRIASGAYTADASENAVKLAAAFGAPEP